jgi:hypothetical protein
MSKVAEVPQPVLSPEAIALIKTLVTELKAPTADEQKKIDAQQQDRIEYGKVEAATRANQELRQKMCPHKMDQGKSAFSALVLHRGSIGLQDSFIVCQCCAKKIFPTDAEWNSALLAANN